MLLKDTIDSISLLKLSDTTATIAAGEMSISTDMNNGNFIVGPLSITSAFTQMRFSSGLLKLNSLLLSTMPSTIVTPVPVFEIDLPIKELSGLMSLATMVLGTAAA